MRVAAAKRNFTSQSKANTQDGRKLKQYAKKKIQ
jgi:hypothetical protein